MNVSIFRPDFFSIFHLLSLFNDDAKIEPKIDPRKTGKGRTSNPRKTVDGVLSLACAWRLAIYFCIVRVEMHVKVKHPSVTSLWLLCSPQKLCEMSCKGVASVLTLRHRLYSPEFIGRLHLLAISVSTNLTCISWASLEFGIPQFAYQSTFLICTLTFYVA